MTNVYEGFVAKIGTKTGVGKRGPWTLYSAKLKKATGEEYDEWVGLGFTQPDFKEGDYIRLEAEEQNGRQKLVEGTVKKLPVPAGQPGSVGKTQAASSGTGSGFRNDPEVQRRIIYQNSRSAAIEVVKLMLDNEALPMSASAGKAGIAKRNEEVLAYVAKLTVEFYNDVDTCRLLESVEDAGAVPATEPEDVEPGDGVDDVD